MIFNGQKYQCLFTEFQDTKTITKVKGFLYEGVLKIHEDGRMIDVMLSKATDGMLIAELLNRRNDKE